MPSVAAKELHDKRLSLLQEARTLIEAEGGLTPETETQVDALHEQADVLGTQVERHIKQEEAEKRISNLPAPPTAPRIADEEEAPTLDEVLRHWALTGEVIRSDGKRVPTPHFDIAGQDKRSKGKDGEQRALEVGTNTEGGHAVDESWVNRLEEALKHFDPLREQGVATVMTTPRGEALHFPTVNDTTNKGERLAEEAEATRADPAFGQLVLNAYKYSSKQILISTELIQDNIVSLESYLPKALGERISRITAEEFMQGAGTAGIPRGLSVAATAGSAEVEVTGAVTPNYAAFVDLEEALDRAYRPGARYMMHRTTLAAVKKLTVGTADSRLLWVPGMAVGEPATINGYPYIVNDEMDTNATSGDTYVLFGDFSKFLIRDVAQVRLVRFGELYMRNDQVGFLMFSRHDSDLLDAGTNPVAYMARA